MSQITEHKTARNKWLIYRAQEYFLKQAEALGFENPEGFENPDEDDDEVTRVLIWEFIIIEAEKLAPVDRKRYGGEEFDSFMAQDTSVLMYEYPDLLHHARMGLKRQKEDRERREHKRRKLTESAGGSAAGGSAAGGSAAGGSAAGASSSAAGGSAGPCPRIQELLEQNGELEAELRQVKSQLDSVKVSDRESRAENEQLKQRIEELMGRVLNLPEPRLRELLDTVVQSLRIISNKVHLGAVKTRLEGTHSFCCPISTDLYQDPVCAADGHTYERVKITNWIRVQLEKNLHNNRRGTWQSPVTHIHQTYAQVHPNTTILSLMHEKIEEELIKMRVKEVDH